MKDELSLEQRIGYEAAIDAGTIDGLNDGGIVRRAFLAGWEAGQSQMARAHDEAGERLRQQSRGREGW